MKVRWKILIAAGILLVLIAASLTVTMRVQPEHEVDAYKKLLRDRGEKLELNEVLPSPTSAEENSVDSVNAAFSLISSGTEKVPDAMKMVAPGRAAVGARQPDARGSDFTNSWDQFSATVEAERPAIDLLHEVLNKPRLDFNLDYTKGFRMVLPQLAFMKRAAQVLHAATVCELHAGDTESATTNILTMLALVQKDFRDDLIISHLVRIAIVNIAIAPTWELLQSTNATDAQLASVQKGWQQLNFLRDAETVFTLERAVFESSIVTSRSSHEAFKETFGLAATGGSIYTPSGGSSLSDELENITTGPRIAMAEAMWRSSWSYSAEMDTLRRNQIILETLRLMETNGTQNYKTNYDQMSSELSSFSFTNAGGTFFRILRIPDLRENFGFGLSSAVRKTILTETARRVVITAIGIKRFQLRHGVLPQTLTELLPEFLPSPPIDPNDGKPLKYHPNDDGTYLLYSVGEDGMDDGGDAGPSKSFSGAISWYWLRSRDWVWPQPASPEEIQYFYEHPPN